MNNILSLGHETCTSCGVCSLSCEKSQAISMNLDRDGFYRPEVDESLCTNCGICVKVCSKFVDFDNVNYKPLQVLAAWSLDSTTRTASASGGIGHELLERAVREGGSAIGAVFDPLDDDCRHEISSDVESLTRFRSSKYVQSRFWNAFHNIDWDNKYAVIGAPCQIYGLNRWLSLKKRKGNFILIDFFCHGTPSLLLWKYYKAQVKKTLHWKNIASVNFRLKDKMPWQKYGMLLHNKNGESYTVPHAALNTEFFRGFLSDKCLNEICYTCPFRKKHFASSIRLGDFWGKKFKSCSNGVTLVTVQDEIGHKELLKIDNKISMIPCSQQDLAKAQPEDALQIPMDRDWYLHSLNNGILPGLLRRKVEIALDISRNKIKNRQMVRKIRSILSLLRENIEWIISQQLIRWTKKPTTGEGILIIPAADLDGGFGEDIMLAAAIKLSPEKVGILTKIPINKPYLKHPKGLVLHGGFRKNNYLTIANVIEKYKYVWVLGADILDGTYGKSCALLRFRAMQIAVMLDKRASVSGCSISENIAPFARRYLSLFKNSIRICAREAVSAERLKRICGLKPDLTSDIAFVSPHEIYSGKTRNDYDAWISIQRQKGMSIAVVCPNAIQASKAGQSNYLLSWHTMLSSLDSTRTALLFLYHDLRDQCNGKSDFDLAGELYSHFRSTYSCFYPTEIEDGVELKSYLQECDFSITGRMHLGISGQSLGKPMFGICYADKFEGLLKLFNIAPEECLVEYTNMSNAGEKLRNFELSLSSQKQKLLKGLDHVLELARSNYIDA